MSEYIDRETAIAKAEEGIEEIANTEYGRGVKDAIYYISETVLPNIPASDVVPVVRCKDCVYYKSGYCAVFYDRDPTYGDELGQYGPAPNDFCSCGERREADT